MWEIDRGNPEHISSEAQIKTSLDDQKEQILADAKQELVNTNFEQLEPKKSIDSFKDKYHSKTWNFVKVKKVSLKWKN